MLALSLYRRTVDQRVFARPLAAFSARRSSVKLTSEPVASDSISDSLELVAEITMPSRHVNLICDITSALFCSFTNLMVQSRHEWIMQHAFICIAMDQNGFFRLGDYLE
jgi:hypothetical protein